jgi:hypothetical protein
MHRFLLSALLCYFMLCLCFVGWGQEENGNLFIQNYRAKKDYNGHTQNWTCYQSPTGLLYIGNNEGLIEYDGVKFKNIETNDALKGSLLRESRLTKVASPNILKYRN